VQTYAMSYSYTKILESLRIDELIDGQHDAIFQAIADRSPERARQAMETHIGTILEICREHGL
jgi:DNA-binding FadR family transcriptional regulator